MAKKVTKATSMQLVPRTEIGFPPFVGSNPEILILGEFPGSKSLSTRHLCNHCYLTGSPCTNYPCTGRYYEHSNNVFRDIIAEIYNNGVSFKTYDDFLKCLDTNHIALWDVYSTQTHLGKILLSQTLNDLETFLKKHSSIRKIIFNGKDAEDVFKDMSIPFTGCTLRVLSTSGQCKKGSNSYLKKLTEWKKVLP